MFTTDVLAIDRFWKRIAAFSCVQLPWLTSAGPETKQVDMSTESNL